MDTIRITPKTPGVWIITKAFPNYKDRSVCSPMYFSVADSEDVDRYNNAGFFTDEEATYIKSELFPDD